MSRAPYGRVSKRGVWLKLRDFAITAVAGWAAAMLLGFLFLCSYIIFLWISDFISPLIH